MKVNAKEFYTHVEIASLGGDVSLLVPKIVQHALQGKFNFSGKGISGIFC